jgi:hypothetical protein
LNQTAKTITGGESASNVRPDVATVRTDGKVDVHEVLSPGQTFEQMQVKHQTAFGEKLGTVTCVNKKC